MEAHVAHVLDCFAHATIAAVGDRELNAVDPGETNDQLRRMRTPCIDQVKDASAVLRRWRLPQLAVLRELRTDGKAERAGLFRRDAGAMQNGGAGFVRQKVIVGAAA